MCFKITGVDWPSFERSKKEGRPIVFCLDGVMVRVMIESCPEADNGWQVEIVVVSITTCQGREKKVNLPSGSKLKGMLIKERMAPSEHDYGWLEIVPALAA
jgi:hypothetical protein